MNHSHHLLGVVNDGKLQLPNIMPNATNDNIVKLWNSDDSPFDLTQYEGKLVLIHGSNTKGPSSNTSSLISEAWVEKVTVIRDID